MKGFSLALVSLCTVCFLFLSVCAWAQEGIPLNLPNEGQHDPNQLNLGEDKALLYEPSVKQIKDSTAIITPGKTMAAPAKPKSGPQHKSEEDALSFNFLYFIIQKFKISDIIDQ